MSTSSSSLRRQLAAAHAATRDAQNALHHVEHPLRVRIAALEAANKSLRLRLDESRREIHTMKVLASTIQMRAGATEALIDSAIASGKYEDERNL